MTFLAYCDDIESIPSDEAADIERVLHAIELILAQTQRATERFQADVHAKTHGYARGELKLSFSVWHALAAHRPLGGINRVRRKEYALSFAWRNRQTGVK